MRHAALALCWIVGLAGACRRDADQPIAHAQLFPDAAPAATPQTDSAKGAVARAEALVESEPNDAPDRAQSVSGMALVAGQLAASTEPAADAAAAEPETKAKKPKSPKPLGLLDQDWYRLPATPAGNLVQIELRDAPFCAELELFDDAGRSVVRRARMVKNSRPVLPSLGPGARASLVRVSCKGKEGGAYTLAVYTRPALPGEELEPNDAPAPDLQILRLGQTLQGTIAPAQDVDLYVLDTAGMTAGDALVLSATGSPDVDWEVRLLDPLTHQTLLARKPPRGQGLIVPNLDIGRLQPGTLVQLKGIAGQAPDTPYAVALQLYLPPGCAAQADCRDRVPGEREPNDLPDHAFPVAYSEVGANRVAGVIDGAGDVDWLVVQGLAGQVATARIEAPASMGVLLTFGDQPKPPQLLVPAGKTAVLPGFPMGDGRFLLSVGADKDGASSRNDAYRLTFKLLDGMGWEAESGDEAQGAQAWSEAASLQPVGAGGQGMDKGGWFRRGALFPAGDRDAFGLDLRTEKAPLGLELSCDGDGAPGLTCALQDLTGRELVSVSPAAEGTAKSLLSLAPGAWRLVVAAAGSRQSLRPYAVRLRLAPEATGLPTIGLSAADPAQHATPSQP